MRTTKLATRKPAKVARSGIHEQAGDLNGLDVIAAGAFARVGFAGPSHEIARGGGGGLGGPIGARERAQTLGGGRHLITAGDHAGDGVKDGSGFSARADGGADGVTLHGLHDAIGTGEIGDGGGEKGGGEGSAPGGAMGLVFEPS